MLALPPTPCCRTGRLGFAPGAYHVPQLAGGHADRARPDPGRERNLEGSLKQRLANPDERAAAVALLQRLRRHPSVTAFVVSEIDADLASIAPRPAAPPPSLVEACPARRPYVSPAPTPADPARTGGGGRAGSW